VYPLNLAEEKIPDKNFEYLELLDIESDNIKSS
jgi:hypothetical protein